MRFFKTKNSSSRSFSVDLRPSFSQRRKDDQLKAENYARKIWNTNPKAWEQNTGITNEKDFVEYFVKKHRSYEKNFFKNNPNA